jgi:sn-glycerol 3-phosphate transport system permease protein
VLIYPFLAAGLGMTLEKLVSALKSVPHLVYHFITYFGGVPADQLLPSLVVGAVFGGLMTALVYLVARGWLNLPSFSNRAVLIAGAALVFAMSAFGLLTALLIGVIALVAFIYLYESNLLGLLFRPSREILLGQGNTSPLVWSVLRALAVAVLLTIMAYITTDLLPALGIALVVLLAMAYLYAENLRKFLSFQTVQRLANRDALITLVTGAGVGAAVGAVSSQLLMYSTKHCTYGPGIGQFEFRLGMVITAISATFLLFPVWLYVLRRGGKIAPSQEITSGNFRGFFIPYLLLVPTLIILVFFLYYPAFQVIQMSLTRTLLGRGSKFACLYNYQKLGEDPVYKSSFITTFELSIAIIVLGMAISLMIASLANQKVRGANIYRAWLIWPYAVSPVVTGVIFQLMFHPQVGPINWGLNEIFGIRPQWFRETNLTPWVVILAAVWNSLGFNVLFYIAGLQNVPSDLLEAAAIDGANRFQRFVRITFPMLSPFTFFLLITNMTYSFFGIFGAVDTLTQGGPWRGGEGATNVLIYNLYQDAFEHQYKIGGAAAQSLILFLLVAGLTLIQFRYVERQVTYGG